MKSALVIIFNQDFSKNIPKLETLYGGRFSHIIYLVPDHSSRVDKFYANHKIPQEFVKLADKAISTGRHLFQKRNPFGLNNSLKESVKERFYRVIGHQIYFYDFIKQASEHLLSLKVDWFWFIGGMEYILNIPV